MMYLFILGREHSVSQAEIAQVFQRLAISYTIEKQIKDHLLMSADAFDEQFVMTQLGGTIKIARHVGAIESPVESITNTLCELQPEGKVRFSLTGASTAVAIQVKKKLQQKGRSVRYIQPKNTATIIHNNLDTRQGDITIVGAHMFVTCAVQDIEGFSKRDYDRPASDSKSGMLPPKLCRMMINLLDGTKKGTLLDPFCGSGTVLMEAMLLGYTSLIGSDISAKAVADTKTNLAWMKQEYPNTSEITYTVYEQQVSSLATTIAPGSIEHIVFEPYMGPPRKGNESLATLEKTAAELTSMFDEAFASFRHILQKDGSIVCIVPRFLTKRDAVRINLLPILANQGFESIPFENQQHLLYKRQGQHVAREIWKIKKTAS